MSVLLQNSRSRTAVLPGLDTDTLAWLNAVKDAGSFVSPSTARSADRMVKRLKSAGLWDKIYMLDCCAGNNLTAALVRLKVPSGVVRAYTNNNFVAADYVETGPSGGLKGDGTTKYLNTLLNPVSQGWSSSSLMLWSYCRETSPAGTTRMQLGVQQTGEISHLGWINTGTTEGIRLAGLIADGANSISATATTGLMGGGCNGSRQVIGVLNGVVGVGTYLATGAFYSANIYAHALNDTGAASGFSVRRISQLLITKGLSAAECATLYAIVQAFETALGRNVR